jgi:hypothetical protein
MSSANSKYSAAAELHGRRQSVLKLFEEDSASVSQSGAGASATQPITATADWMHLFFSAVFVSFCILVGLNLIMLPWTSFWTSNPLVAPYGGVRDVLNHNFVRGAVAGLGVVDIWIGITEVLRHLASPAK